jgi:hypothetical protein
MVLLVPWLSMLSDLYFTFPFFSLFVVALGGRKDGPLKH